jgi:signal transduction histidine kinase
VVLADPEVGAGELRVACEEVLAAGEHQERLVDGLLTLATSERGLERREAFDLADAARQGLAPHRAEAGRRGLAVTTDFRHATVLGGPDLAERMAANLIDNAIRYNVPSGHVDVTTEARHGHTVLTVTNTGPVIPANQAGQLLQPFQRLPAGQAGHPDGHGLGLSIVHAIATAHAAPRCADPAWRRAHRNGALAANGRMQVTVIPGRPVDRAAPPPLQVPTNFFVLTVIIIGETLAA